MRNTMASFAWRLWKLLPNTGRCCRCGRGSFSGWMSDVVCGVSVVSVVGDVSVVNSFVMEAKNDVESQNGAKWVCRAT
jgi:hypothetical protein